MTTLTNDEAIQLIAGMRANHEKHGVMLLCAEALRMAEAALRGPAMTVEHSQFLSDVTTAAGLLAHGKRCKSLADRIGAACARIRETAAPSAPADVMAADTERLDSRMIAIAVRDEFGEQQRAIYYDIDLRAAIDDARAAEKGTT